MYQVLQWLDGKKAMILAIISAINSYLGAAGVYSADLVALIQTIISILAGGAVFATNQGKRAGKIVQR